MYKTKKIISFLTLCVLLFSLCACGEKSSEGAVTNNESEASHENIAEDINVPEIVQHTASEFERENI